MKLTAEEKKEFLAKLVAEANDHGFESKVYDECWTDCWAVFTKNTANRKTIARFDISLRDSGYQNSTYVVLRDIFYYFLKTEKIYRYNTASLKKKTGNIEPLNTGYSLYFDISSFSLSGVLAAFFKKVDEVNAHYEEEQRSVNRAKKLAEIRNDELLYTLEEVKNKLEETFPGLHADIKTVLTGNFYKITLYNYEIPVYPSKKVITLSQAEYKEYGLENRLVTEYTSCDELPDISETPLFTMHEKMWADSNGLYPSKLYGEWIINIKYAGENNWDCELDDHRLPFNYRKIRKPAEILSWVEWVIGNEKKCYAAFKEYRKTIKTVVMERKK